MDENTGDEMLNIKSVNSRVLASEMMLVARVGWEVWFGHLLVAVCVASLPLMWLSGGCTYYHDSHRLVTNHASGSGISLSTKSGRRRVRV